MKSIKRFLSIILSLIIVLAIVSGCGSNKSHMDIHLSKPSHEIAEDYAGMTPEERGEGDFTVENKSSPLEPTKVIVRFFLDIQTIEFDESISALEGLIAKNQAYIENSNMNLGDYYNQSSYRSANYVIRVPKTNVDKFMNEAGSIGKINSLEESKEDVTMHYRDTESRLKVINIKEERILELLKKAEKMEDIIALENTLSDIIYQKENLTGVLQNLDNKVDFSTLTIHLREVQKINLKDDGKVSFSQRISNAFSNSLHSFKIGFENFIIQLIYLIPLIIILGILGFFISIGIRFYINKKRSNKNNDNK